jgi:hypothetical protein
MLEFVPLHEGLNLRGTQLVKWFAEASGEGWKILEPKEWFHKVHTAEGKYIWCPPLAIANVALEQLCESRHM